MSKKTALKNTTYEALLKEFSAKVGSLSAAENGLNTDTAKKAFRETMKKHFVLVNEHGTIVKETGNKPAWDQQEPGIDY